MSRELIIEHWFDWDLNPASGPTGAISGTAAITFGQSGTLTATGALAATATITFGSSATLTGTGALAATAALSFGQSGTLTGTGALSGSIPLVFGQTGSLTGTGVLSGSSALVFGSTAALTGTGALSGSSALTFGETGTLDQPSGSLIGTASLTFAANATLAGDGTLLGVTSILFDASATADGTQPVVPVVETPAGRRTRHIYRVTIDGQVFEFRNYAQACAFLDQAKRTAEQLAPQKAQEAIQTKSKPALPRITANTRELRPVISQTQRSIAKSYRDAVINAEIALLFEVQAKNEHNDEILMLLL